jgi:hypothetical protein
MTAILKPMRLLHVVVVLAILAPSVARIACGFDCMRVKAQAAAASCHEAPADRSHDPAVRSFDTADCHSQQTLLPSIVSASADALAVTPIVAQLFGAMSGAPRAMTVPAWTVKPPGIRAVPLRI